jgi:hypothetical protein
VPNASKVTMDPKDHGEACSLIHSRWPCVPDTSAQANHLVQNFEEETVHQSFVSLKALPYYLQSDKWPHERSRGLCLCVHSSWTTVHSCGNHFQVLQSAQLFPAQDLWVLGDLCDSNRAAHRQLSSWEEGFPSPSVRRLPYDFLCLSFLFTSFGTCMKIDTKLLYLSLSLCYS